MMVVFWLLGAVSALGIAGCAVATITVVRRFSEAGTGDVPHEAPPALSMIVPIKGADAHTARNLSALVASDVPGPVEYLFAMESTDDPAYEVCETVRHSHPDKAIRVVLTGPAEGRMGKQHNLAVAERQARYDVIGSMDADVWVDADTLATGLARLSEPRVGVAYFLPCYWGGGPVGGALVALYTNYSFALNMAALALQRDQAFIIGSLWLMARDTLQRIGGLEQFCATVSDDAAIGAAVARHGLRNVLVPRAVRTPFEPLGLRGGATHVLKWLAMLRAEGLAAYSSILALWHPVLWAAIAVVAALALRGPRAVYLAYGVGLLASAILIRIASALWLNRRVYHMAATGLALLLAPYELLAVPVLFGLGLFRHTIEWRGRRYRLGHHGVIQGVAEAR